MLQIIWSLIYLKMNIAILYSRVHVLSGVYDDCLDNYLIASNLKDVIKLYFIWLLYLKESAYHALCVLQIKLIVLEDNLGMISRAGIILQDNSVIWISSHCYSILVYLKLTLCWCLNCSQKHLHFLGLILSVICG